MKDFGKIFRATVGKKYVMAITGASLLLFVTGHMLGNLQIFLGPEAINRYAHFLKSNVELLWPVRIALLTLVLLHIGTGIALTLENWQSRPQRYAVRKVVGATWSARTMIWSGAFLFCFVTYHLAHFTALLIHPEYRNLLDAQGMPDVYRMVILGFQQPLVSGFYLLSVGLLAFHLSHGIGAFCQSLGLKNEVYAGLIDRLAGILAVALFLGYGAIPVAVLIGLGR